MIEFIYDPEFICNRFVFKNSGVLYENPVLQIGIKSEFNNNLGKLVIIQKKYDLLVVILARYGVFFGNKSKTTFMNFATEITVPPESQNDIHDCVCVCVCACVLYFSFEGLFVP